MTEMTWLVLMGLYGGACLCFGVVLGLKLAASRKKQEGTDD